MDWKAFDSIRFDSIGLEEQISININFPISVRLQANVNRKYITVIVTVTVMLSQFEGVVFFSRQFSVSFSGSVDFLFGGMYSIEFAVLFAGRLVSVFESASSICIWAAKQNHPYTKREHTHTHCMLSSNCFRNICLAKIFCK